MKREVWLQALPAPPRGIPQVIFLRKITCQSCGEHSVPSFLSFFAESCRLSVFDSQLLGVLILPGAEKTAGHRSASCGFLARPGGFEPTTNGIGIRYSIRTELRADLCLDHYITIIAHCKVPDTKKLNNRSFFANIY